MTPQVVKLDKRTRVKGFWLLPGTQLEFDNIGQANTFIFRNGGTLVEAPKPKPTRSKKGSNVNRVDADTDAGTGDAASDHS